MHESSPTNCVAPTVPAMITGHALVEARLSEIGGLRDQPGPTGAPALPHRFLRHSDEHTVVGVHAVLRAIAERGSRAADVSRHGVVSASCQLGRLAAAKTLANLATGGGVSVSPHIVPQCSLHAVAGAVSVGLGMRGPHFGVGGGVDALAEGLLAAMSLLESAGSAGQPSCVWLVATEWDEEPALDASGAAVDDPLCRGLALSIEPDATDPDAEGDRRTSAAGRNQTAAERRGSRPVSSALTLSLRACDAPRLHDDAAGCTGRLAEFARAIAMCREGTALVSWAVECPWGAEIRVSRRSRPTARTVPAVRLRGAA